MVPQRLLVTDVDGTLVGDDAALGRFAAWRAGPGRDDLIAYATGRTLDGIRRLVAEEGAPRPDILIALVGTEIYDRDGRPWPGWLDRFEGWDARAVDEVLAGDGRFERQPEHVQSPRKASFYARLEDDELADVGRRLVDAGIEHTLVYSGDRYLDVLPSGAGKGPATRFVADALGVPADGVLVFGDSGNDLDLFREGYRATAVANATRELLAGIGADVYRSPLPYADGILDGLRHWSSVSASP